MSPSLRILTFQLPAKAGHLLANLKQIEQHLHDGRAKQADLVVFPELALTGAGLQDLFCHPDLEQQLQLAMQHLARLSHICPFLLGLPLSDPSGLQNGCAFFSQGRLQWQLAKQQLSTDERRYFTPGHEQSPILNLGTTHLGIAFGTESLRPEPFFSNGQSPDLLLVLAADPFYLGRRQQREQTLAATAQQLGCPLLLANAAGCQDESIFAGQSCLFNASGALLHRAAALTQDSLEFDLHSLPVPRTDNPAADDETALVYQALCNSLAAYVENCGFNGVLLGLSGGIDSALVLAIAADALGADRVTAVMLPYHYTAQISLDDAAEQAARTGVAYHVVPVAGIVQQFGQSLAPLLEHWPASQQDTTEQNLQARSRGTLLMGLSNRSGALLLTTSNKSESAVGYCTLYGDMAGGFAPLKDVPKTLVYRLARYRNGLGPVIPERVITRAPTAELAPGQSDTDSLPPYPLLDEIIRLRVEENLGAEAIIARGLDAETVTRILRLIDFNEYKRQQAAMGPKITKAGFGRERRMPLSARLHPLSANDLTGPA